MAETQTQGDLGKNDSGPPMVPSKSNGAAPKAGRAPRGSKQTYLLVVTGEDGMYAKAGEGKEHTKGIVDDLLVRGYKPCETLAEFESADGNGQSVFFCVAGHVKTPTLPQSQVTGL